MKHKKECKVVMINTSSKFSYPPPKGEPAMLCTCSLQPEEWEGRFNDLLEQSGCKDECCSLISKLDDRDEELLKSFISALVKEEREKRAESEQVMFKDGLSYGVKQERKKVLEIVEGAIRRVKNESYANEGNYKLARELSETEQALEDLKTKLK